MTRPLPHLEPNLYNSLEPKFTVLLVPDSPFQPKIMFVCKVSSLSRSDAPLCFKSINIAKSLTAYTLKHNTKIHTHTHTHIYSLFHNTYTTMYIYIVVDDQMSDP